jgi:hypothetical protein
MAFSPGASTAVTCIRRADIAMMSADDRLTEH